MPLSNFARDLVDETLSLERQAARAPSATIPTTQGALEAYIAALEEAEQILHDCYRIQGVPMGLAGEALAHLSELRGDG